MSKAFIEPPAGNKLYLTCVCGLDPLELGRRKVRIYAKAVHQNRMEDWFEQHAECAHEPDHYRLGYAIALNWDVPKDADPVANAVRLELVRS